MRYAVAGAITGFDTGEIIGHLWNPSTTRAFYIVHASLSISATSGVAEYISLRRTTTAGTTPGATVTPDADNAFNRMVAPPSGAILYLGNFATAPTQSRTFQNWLVEARAGAVLDFTFKGRGARILPGQGVGWNGGAGLASGEVSLSFTWDEP